MSASQLIRCPSCKGLKQRAGMGGMVYDCVECDGKGKIKLASTTVKGSLAVEAVPDAGIKKRGRPKKSGLECIPKDCEVETQDLSQSTVAFPPPSLCEAPKGPMMSGYDDEFIKAVLDEPNLDPFVWKAKYQHIKSLFGVSIITGQVEEIITKVARAGIRAQYAQNQHIAPRSVDVGKAQDDAASNDAAHLAYISQEKLRTDKLLNAADKKKAVRIKDGA